MEDTEEQGWLAEFWRRPLVYGGAVLVILYLLGNWAVQVHRAQASGITWETDLAHAKVESARSDKPIFIEFGANWCGQCKHMQNEVFMDPRVTPILSQMICVHIDVDHDPDTAEAYGVHGIPRMLLLTPDLDATMDLTGGRSEADFEWDLRGALKKSGYTLTSSNSPATQQ